ncbi:peroxiredoxin [Chelativorans salis]|uniref:Glutathione-dependent peroxiredoxin n=1 Tax=Chelativorans salis TaxID=2978478 RepID=A0ABT2LJH0_9HYPH|nr:peroxiredoxin [Chelativorans sp. EGI FJ00035]MCT7373563.1 peroxiredoxin [Chelativorans sp. EGI FJ00035]
MTISIGDRLPEVMLKKASPEGAEDIRTVDFFAGRKVVMIGVPGAFTPTCSNDHVPGFAENYDAIRARGVDAIAVLAVNDHHVMGAWARFTGAENKLVFLADGNGVFTRALGLETDMSERGLGARCRRFSMVVEDGIVKELNIEEARGQAITSGAARILEQL